MSLYPPLTEAQLAELRSAIEGVWRGLARIADTPLTIPQRPGDEDQLAIDIATFRLRVQSLDRTLFAIFDLIHRLKTANTPPATSAPAPRKPSATIDDLEGMF